VGAEYVDFSSRVAEERAESARDDLERPLTSGPVGLPVVRRNNQEEVMSVRRNVRFPEVLEVVVVRRRPAALYLSDDLVAYLHQSPPATQCARSVQLTSTDQRTVGARAP